MADVPEQLPDPDRLIARALESVLDAVPDVPGGDIALPEQNPTIQPWAETTAPAGRDKRPLEELVAEFAARVAASPGALAGRPNEKHPAEVYLESLSPSTGGRRKRRRWHGGRRRGGDGEPAAGPERAGRSGAGAPNAAASGGRSRGGRRRGRRRG